MLRVLRQQGDVVDCDVGASRCAQRLKGAGALGGLDVPHLTQGEQEEKRREGISL